MSRDIRVPIYQLEFEEDFVSKYQRGCERIFNSDALSEGTYVDQFESEFREFQGVQHCVMTSSCTTALEIAFRAVEVDGGNVVMPTNTFVATGQAIRAAGGAVNFVDIERGTYAIDPAELKRAIDESTEAVVIVHIGGMISKYIDEIVDICDEHGVPLIEDAAHAHGASRGPHKAGAIGDIGCFSFFPTKVMTTGEGGMVTTNDEHLAERARSLKNFGKEQQSARTSRAQFTNDGINGRVTEFQGLLGTLELERVEQRIQQRNELADQYRERLRDTPYEVATMEEGFSPHYKLIVETPGDASDIEDYCLDNGIQPTGRVYETPVHRQPAFAGCVGEDEQFPVAESFAAEHICPPLYPELESEDVDYVSDVLASAIEATV